MSHVYFVQEMGGAIKIAASRNLKERAARLKNCHKLKLIGAMQGDQEVEKSVQQMFQDCHLQGKWYRPEPKLLRYISTHARLEEVPLDLEKAVKEWEGKPLTDAGTECRRLLEMSEYRLEEIPPSSDRLLTVEEAAAMLGVSSQTLRNWDKSGKIVAMRTEGGHRRYSESQIHAVRKDMMRGAEFVIHNITANDLLYGVQKLLAQFEPLENINLSVRHDTLLGKVTVTIDSEDGLTTITKSFNMKD